MRVEKTENPSLAPVVPLLARPLLSVLAGIERGSLVVKWPNGSRSLCEGPRQGGGAAIEITRPARLTARVLSRGALGFAEAYLAGDWSSPDLPELLFLLAENEATLGGNPRGNLLVRLRERARHMLRRNSRRGSRRNIAHHYDLGNDFYSLWLDETMTYSSAVFDNPNESLARAQRRKYALVLDRLQAKPGQRILEIGCGWGGRAREAACRGLRVTGITLSREQLAFARERLRRAGLAGRIELRLQDYRDVLEEFDHVVSIEMFEAVGEAYWPAYFESIRRVLRRGGRAALQVITIDDGTFDAYRREADFVQKYIFPGGMLPSLEAFRRCAAEAGLATRDVRFYGGDYALTLRRWDEAVRRAAPAIRKLGFDDRFLRMWRYYLAYCEAGFRDGRIDLMQVTLEDAGSKP